MTQAHPAYDVLIPCATKDRRKLPYVLRGVYSHLRGFKRVYVAFDTPPEQSWVRYDCQEAGAVPKLTWVSLPTPGDGQIYVRCMYEEDLFPLDKQTFSYRPAWQYQMYLKLFQQYTDCAWYLTLDCDLILLRDLPMFRDDGVAYYYVGRDQQYEPYFRFQQEMLGFGRVCRQSCVADMNFINRPLVRDLLDRHGYTLTSFIDRAAAMTTLDCHMGEPEFYGNFVEQYHKKKYCVRQLAVADGDARHQHVATDEIYTNEDIEKAIAVASKTGLYDTLPLHSWWEEKHVTDALQIEV